MSVALALFILVSVPTLVACGDNSFSHNVNFKIDDDGERLKLHSSGVLSDVIDLDTLTWIKRLVCVEQKILLVSSVGNVATDWKVGQLLLGSSRWRCNAINDTVGGGIYAKISGVYFPTERRIAVHVAPAGPYDMIQEANIHFRYSPGKAGSSPEVRERSRRSLSNILTKILGTIDWRANFSTSIPFNEDLGGTEADKVFTLHKTLGDKELSVALLASADDLKGQTDDFMVRCLSCHSRADVSYVFELLIKKVNNEPQLLKYISQLEAESSLVTDLEVEFSQEMGVNYSSSLWQSDPTQLISIPVAVVRGLPPVELTLAYNTQALANVHGYSGGKALLRNGFVSSGKYTISQTFSSSSAMNGDITSYDWDTRGQDLVTMDVNTPLNITVDVYQKIFFNSSISWRAKDITINLSPPMEITLRPSMKIETHNKIFTECVSTSVAVDGQYKAATSELSVEAFGINIWDVVLNLEVRKHDTLISTNLTDVCRASCDSPSELGPPLAAADVCGGMKKRIARNSPDFRGLRLLRGDMMQFSSEEADDAWCGAPGGACWSCDADQSDPSQACADRLVSSRMAPAITKLAHLVRKEWPNASLVVLEAWDEPTSTHPQGQHGNESLHYEGRAAVVTLTGGTNGSDWVDSSVLRRLGSLCVCSGFEYVKIDNHGISVQLAVKEDGSQYKDLEEDPLSKSMFADIMEETDIDPRSLNCTRFAPSLNIHDTVPDGVDLESVVGPPKEALSRLNREDLARLYYYLWNDLTFDPEENINSWCSVPTRTCSADCHHHSNITEPWDWCSNRMMSHRMALKLRQLAKIAARENMEVTVKTSLLEQEFLGSTQHSHLYYEGRALELSTKHLSDVPRLAVLAACSGFDFTSFTAMDTVQVFVKSQGGQLGTRLEYVDEDSTRLSVNPPPSQVLEYSYPESLREESVQPPLGDGFDADTFLSEHYTISDILAANRRYFRFDPSLLLCLDMISDDLEKKVEILPGSAYRPQSVNMINYDIRHAEELDRFQAGQAVEIRQQNFGKDTDLAILAKSIFRSCTPFLRQQMRGIGVGCHEDRLYLDVRPLEVGREMDYITVWDTSNNRYCQEVTAIKDELLVGGPAIVPFDDGVCSMKPLGDAKAYLTFQFHQKGMCSTSGQKTFCAATKPFRQTESQKLQERMTSAAGFGRLPRADIHQDLDACVVNLCGGCPAAGPVWDRKVKACTVVVDKFISRATRAFPDLTDRATFFNTETADSTVHSLSCHDGNICVENIQLYSLLMLLMTSRYRLDPTASIEILLFSTEKNPSPLLELVEQEMAYRARGKVKVFVEAYTDIKNMKVVLKVLMVYNPNVTEVEFHVADELDVDLVTADLQRNIDVWAGNSCPDHSRFAVAPYSFHDVSYARRRRSVERSQHRNEARRKVLHWEMDWLMKML